LNKNKEYKQTNNNNKREENKFNQQKENYETIKPTKRKSYFAFEIKKKIK